MITSVYAKIEYVTSTKMLFVANNWGYWVNVKPNSGFSRSDTNVLIFLHELAFVTQNNSLSKEFYAFKSLKEKEWFKSLLTVNGIGPKTAINIMANNQDDVLSLIKNNDLEGLLKLENMNKKIATILLASDIANKGFLRSQILNDKENEEESKSKKQETNQFQADIDEVLSDLVIEAIDCLINLGYKQEQIQSALCEIDFKKETINDSADLVAVVIKQIGLRTSEIN
ncbi:Holliday junction branch migration protein RuvA [Mycoplasma bradburyae]|uniref:Holliday junction branch migration complex subunit RuvA n=1 Tax=Mycoplasma bradburyae TaxID=2963128 RepID=A0AAW6HRT0_9MOLU|nr:Holliday junction branch migration protein RuvA [Mycoplasma bradburyae]MDC4162991.1 Holliday junction branch migration protein RuvA [Mycoplasma bradburyae]MDC4181602.1 Holliday junction branch migration protein RuvA [Mycoplasma bradburyae]MDC4182328.1 Holliday junction branch migration protein RuvA [Mycoplasma bradburyae]MDC4183055.1 Holliday junction branch migration protein RuvA [Mycoplasma bradburyae]MDC4183773.1 Holliday junction branch migration protein RuvA [Mycoplasma bradburyae]